MVGYEVFCAIVAAHLVGGMLCHRLTGFLYIKQLSVYGFYYIMLTLMLLGLMLPTAYSEYSGRPGFEAFLSALLIHTLAMSAIYTCAFLSLRGSKSKKRDFVYEPLQIGGKNVPLYMAMLLAVSLALIISQLIMLPKIPILMILSGESGEALTLAREEGFKTNESMLVYLWHLNRQLLAPVLVLVSYIRMQTHRTLAWRAMFFVTLGTAVLGNSISSALAPVALLFLMLILVHVGMARRLAIGPSVTLVALMLSFPIAVEYAYSETGLLESAYVTLTKMASRFSWETADRSLTYFDLFNGTSEYLGGRTNALVRLFTGLEPFNVQNYVFLERLDSKSIREHLLTGSANAHFIGYMNSDFGLRGVLVASLLVGYILGIFEAVYISLDKNELVIALYVITITLFWKLMGTQPTTILFSHGASLMLIWAIYASKRSRRRKQLHCQRQNALMVGH